MDYLASFYGISSELRPKEVIALRLCHEIDVLDTSFLESYCPVGIVLAHRRIYVEAAGPISFGFTL